MIITSASHLDHALTPDQIGFILSKFQDRNEFFIATFELPEDHGTVPCALYGPAMGDPPVSTGCIWENRPGRAYPSRLVNLPARPTRTVTVIAGPHEGVPCILYTAFGGPLAPKELGDSTLEIGSQAYQESVLFWSQHALAK